MTTPTEEYRLISLTRGQVAVVDAADFKSLRVYRWKAHWNKSAGHFYVDRNTQVDGRSKTITMARQIMNLPDGDPRFVDHRNHNTLDNRRSNLRVCSNAQNQWNGRKKTSNSTGVKGVYPRRGGFRVQIRVKGKRISLGDVKTVEEGRILYAEAARRYHGDFAFPS